MLDILLMKIFIVIVAMPSLAIWIRYIRLSRIRKSGAEMPAPFMPLALATGILDRGFVLISSGYALFFLLWGYPDMFLRFSCYFDFPLQLMGMALLGVAIFGAWWGIASLGEFNEPRWSPLKQGHAVVKKGTYRYIRHPLYASRTIIYLGAFLFFEDLLFLFLFLSLALLVYFQAKSEEKLLTKVFGEEYTSYQAATGMFLPPVINRWAGQMRIATLWRGQKLMINPLIRY
jgi:protein-S-isoprenylcysteine O-methyltransferase Ste14